MKHCDQLSILGNSAKPFLKWAGGKQQLLKHITQRIPRKFKDSGIIPNYIEPFVGGGAVYFHLKSNFHIGQATLMDINPDLILSYKVVQAHVDNLIELLQEYQSRYHTASEDERKVLYYTIRDTFNTGKNDFDFDNYGDDWIVRTAQLIFLNKTCFNGLYRQNQKGEFNVPQGSYSKPTICDQGNLQLASEALIDSRIICTDFYYAESISSSDTLLYYDPPYRPLNTSSSFNNYTQDGFSDSDQIRLSEMYRRIDKLGANQILSNSDPRNANPDDMFFDNIFSGFCVDRVEAKRFINCNGEKRGTITELLVTNY